MKSLSEMSGVSIRKAELKIQLPVHCQKCGFVQMSELIQIEMTDTNLHSLSDMISATRVGTRHPVGWSSHYSKKGTIYHCPDCTHGSSDLLWQAALTTFNALHQQPASNPHNLMPMESVVFLDHLDADREKNAAIVQMGSKLLAIWTAADGESFASGLLPLGDPNDAEVTSRDFGEVVRIWVL